MPTPAYPKEWSVSPETLIDEILLSIPRGRGRRRRYKSSRQNMLEGWAPAGLDILNVVEGPPGMRDPATLADPVAAGMQPGQIILTRSPTGANFGEVNMMGDPYVGMLGVDPEVLQRGLRRRATSYLPHVMSHEMGHVLGLGHNMTDWDSVMNPNEDRTAPSSADLAALIGPDVGLPDPDDPGYRSPGRRALRRKRG
jgi:hypothetical protein